MRFLSTGLFISRRDYYKFFKYSEWIDVVSYNLMLPYENVEKSVS